mgnify:CR=1 FL=1
MKKANTNSVIKTIHLSVGYQQKKQKITIANEINLDLHKGKFVALIGKNGIGKSTLLRTLCNVQNPLSGSILLNNEPLHSFDNKSLATELSLVLTERLPESQLTVYELIALGRQPYTNWVDTLSEDDKNKISEAIKLTEVEHLVSKRFYELSDGQLQRVLIARALAQDTQVIVLDEPTSHLDMHHTFKIFNLLKKLVATTQKTILVSTHQINLAIQIVDELIVMNENSVTHGVVSEIVESNCMESLFPKGILSFNKEQQQFIITQDN